MIATTIALARLGSALAQGQGRMPDWAWALIILALLVIFALWWRGRAASEPAPAEARAAHLSLAPDDLKRIEGIGPVIAGVLQAAGITTFTQLAATDPERIRAILVAADPRWARISDPSTWPEQARLAAAGDWPAFEALTAQLKAGRRV